MLTLILSAFIAAGSPGLPWELGPFVAPAAEVARASASLRAAEDAHWEPLLRDIDLVVDEAGRLTAQRHMVFRPLSAEAVRSGGVVSASWEPRYQDRPVIRARVISPSGQEYPLDPATLSEAAVEPPEGMVTDRRVVRGPLPGVQNGSVVEILIVERDREPYHRSGSSWLVDLSDPALRRLRVRLDAPASLPLKFVVRGLAPAHEERTAGGRRVLRWDWKNLPASPSTEDGQPAVLSPEPHLAFSSGASWEAVAEGYAALLEPQLAGADLGALARELTAGASGRDAQAVRVLRHIRERVRYTGLELGMAAIVPVKPREVLTRRYGDCKDVSLLFVALMRALGHEADVALLRTGPTELDPNLPGLGFFDHAIVSLGGARPIFLDPLAPELPLGVLPPGVDGKLALVARRGTKALVTLPVTSPAAYKAHVERQVRLQASGLTQVTEVRTYDGALAAELRDFARDRTADQVARSRVADVKERLEADEATVSAETREDGQLVVRGEAKGSKLGRTLDDDAEARLDPRVLACLPSELVPEAPSSAEGGASRKPARERALAIQRPCSGELDYRVVPPPGFEPVEPLPVETKVAVGPFRFAAAYARERGDALSARFSLSLPRGPLAAKDVNEIRAALSRFGIGGPSFKFRRTSTRLLEAGRGREALSELRRLAAAAPRDHEPQLRLALGYRRLGLGDAARAAARRAVALAPESGWAHRVLAIVLEEDLVSRRRKRGCDVGGAVKAARRAAILEPKVPGTLAMLGGFLLDGEDCGFLGRGARPEEAAELFLKARKDFDYREYDSQLLWALVAAGRYADAARTALELPQGAVRDGPLLAALAMDGRLEQAVGEAGRLPPKDRATALHVAVRSLSYRREYGRAAQLIDRAGDGADDVAGLRALGRLLHDASRLEETAPAGSPQRGVVRWIQALNGVGAIRDTVAAGRSAPERAAGPLGDRLLRWGPEGFAAIAAPDLTAATLELREDETARDLARVSITFGSLPAKLYLLRAGATWRLLAAQQESGELALEALRRLERRDVEGARVLLRWANEDRGPREPQADYVYSLVDTSSADPAKATVADLRLLAALLGAAADAPAPAAALLEEALSGPLPDATRRSVQAALAEACMTLERWPRLLELSDALRDAAPNGTAAYRIRALGGLRRGEDVRRAVRAVAEGSSPVPMLRAVGHAALFVGEIDEGIALVSRVTQGEPRSLDLNNLAWARLFQEPTPPTAVQEAQRASELDHHRDRVALHSLAAVLARTGEPGAAMQALRDSIGLYGDTIEPHDWLVVGFVAEAYGEKQEAIAAYRRVGEAKRWSPFSSAALAQRALARLTAGADGAGGR